MGKLGFFFDSDACIGCHTCIIACKDRNGLPVDVNFRKVVTFGIGSYPDARCFHLSIACNHCDNPACAAACPTGAMHVGEDGTVQHDDSACIGCRSCTMACPYGAPQFLPEKGIVGKCDSCKPFRDAGENPVCVDACIMRCLEFGDIDELRAKHGDGLVSELPVLPEASLTTPSLLIKPKEYSLAEGAEEVTL